MFNLVVLPLISFLIDIFGVAVVAQVPDVVPELKEWVEGLVSQRPYSERAWMELSKGQ